MRDGYQNGKAEDPLSEWTAKVTAHAIAFEARWTMLQLRLVDPELAANLTAQQGLWHEAQFLYRGRGDGLRELIEHGAAMCRGYAAATAAMEAAGAEDNAYMIGRDPRTGTVVAIGHQKAALDRVRSLHGEDVVFLSADEVASLFGSIEALKAIGAIKQKFPGAEIIQRYQDEPAKEDS